MMASSSGQTISRYIDTLDSVARSRYEMKLQCLKGIDPYENTEWSTDSSFFPPIQQDDISEYLVHKTSFYTRKKFKAFKQMQAHNQLTSGWVKALTCHKPIGSDNTIITAEVFHSQSLAEKPLKPWVVAEADGNVVTAHCNCMAGLAESCTHIAALMFAVDAYVRLRDSKTPTQVLATWVVPPSKNVVYSEACNIDFSSAMTKKRQLDESVNGSSFQGKSKRKLTQVPHANQDDIMQLYEAVQFSQTGIKPAILSVIPNFAADYCSTEAVTKLPLCLGDLADGEEATKRRNFQEILDYCCHLDISCTKEQADLAERMTRGQAKSKLWMRLRTGRVTASKAHQAAHTNPAQPSLSLIRDICRSHPGKETPEMRWGKENEKKALDAYRLNMIELHSDFKLEDCGLFISTDHPFLGASPDGMRSCKCHGVGCVEVKCPATKAAATIEECFNDPKFCLEKKGTTIQLKKNHQYYTQIQTQMLVTESAFSDFVIWTSKDMIVLTVDADAEFWDDIVPKLKHVFYNAVLPEMVGHVFSSKSMQPLSPSKDDCKQGADDKQYCYCKRGEDADNMVACDNVNCGIEWFHFFCVGIKSNPKGRWYCPECRQLPEFKRGGKVQPVLHKK